MKKLLSLLPIVTLALMMSCTEISGVEVTQTFPVSGNYTKLYISDGIDVIVSDQVSEIVVTADESVMEKIVVQFTSNTLKIYRNDFSLVHLTDVTVKLPYNERLNEVEATLSSSFYSPFTIEADDVKINLSSSSEFECAYVYATHYFLIDCSDHSKLKAYFDTDDFTKLTLDNDASVSLYGYTPTLDLVMSRNSLITDWMDNGYYTLECDYCYGYMRTDCEGHIHCNDLIETELTNNSWIFYTGDCEVDYSYVDDTSDIQRP